MTIRWFSRPGARDPGTREGRWPPVPPEVLAFHRGLPGYAPTALTEMPALAAELGVGRVFVKDESARLGLPAFKALGATWAIHRVLAARAAAHGAAVEENVTLVTATDGNHGRAVARTARLRGLAAHVVVPDDVHPAAVAAISAEGAQITLVTGSYDDAVRRAAEVARSVPGGVLVQDTAWPGYEEVPGWIVEGYATLFTEVDAQLAEAGSPPPALVVVPVGVGSLAQAAVTHYRSAAGGDGGGGEGGSAAGGAGGACGRGRPALLAVEPETAAGVLASLVADEAVSVPTGRTIMAGLNCGTPSALAWPRLRAGLDAAVAVGDADAAAAAATLAGLGISSGPCGAATLAGARAALTGAAGADRRAALGVGPAATVVLLSTEGVVANPRTTLETTPETPPGGP